MYEFPCDGPVAVTARLGAGSLEVTAEDRSTATVEVSAYRNNDSSREAAANARVEMRDGRLTGELADPPVAGERKAQRMAEYAEARGIDLAESIAYGDSADDLPMLARAGRAAVVNPKGRLLDQAVARNWEILHWDLDR